MVCRVEPDKLLIASILFSSFPYLASIELFARLRFINNSLSFSFNKSCSMTLSISGFPSLIIFKTASIFCLVVPEDNCKFAILDFFVIIVIASTNFESQLCYLL